LIRRAIPWPNPNPRAIAIEMAGPAQRVTLKVYTPAWVLVGCSEAGPFAAGWDRLPWPTEMKGAPRGLYYFVVQAQEADRRSPERLGRCFLY
jgi:hypothetical protein